MNSFNSEDFFLRQAVKQARLAYEKDEVPVGCVIVCKGRIIAKAHNQMKALNDPTAHAELIAITMACDSLKSHVLSDCVLYTTLEPCIMCSGAIVLAKMKEVVFIAEDKRFGGQTKADVFSRSKNIWSVSVGQNASHEIDIKALLKSFFAKQRRISEMERWLSG